MNAKAGCTPACRIGAQGTTATLPTWTKAIGKRGQEARAAFQTHSQTYICDAYICDDLTQDGSLQTRRLILRGWSIDRVGIINKRWMYPSPRAGKTRFNLVRKALSHAPPEHARVFITRLNILGGWGQRGGGIISDLIRWIQTPHPLTTSHFSKLFIITLHLFIA